MDAAFRPYFPPPEPMPQAMPSTEPDLPWQLEMESMDWVLVSEFVVEDWLEGVGLELAHLMLGPRHDGDAEGEVGRELARMVRERAGEARRQRRARYRLQLVRNAVDPVAGRAVLASLPGPIPLTVAQPLTEA